jgi:hypothetical protein
MNDTKAFISWYPIFIMVRDNSSNKYSRENYNLLDGMKRYLRIEHKEDDKELLDYLRKQSGLFRDWPNTVSDITTFFTIAWYC